MQVENESEFFPFAPVFAAFLGKTAFSRAKKGRKRRRERMKRNK